jgi:hypothetical protein
MTSDALLRGHGPRHGLTAIGPRGTGILPVVGVLIFGAMVAAGCGPRDTRVRHRVSGKITYGGKPVAGGEIIITPDGAKKNTGAQGIATIKDGTYDTQGSRAPGVGGGPMSAMVMGLLEADGSRFFEHTLPIDCSTSGDTVFDIEIAPGDAPERKQTPI